MTSYTSNRPTVETDGQAFYISGTAFDDNDDSADTEFISLDDI